MTARPVFRSAAAASLIMFLVLGAAGCGSGTASVSGKVTINGRPVTSGIVTLVGADGKSGIGQIQADGTYRVNDAPVGTVKATVNNPPPLGVQGGAPLAGGPADEEMKEARAQAARYVRVPPQYSDPDKSNLSYVLRSGGNVIDIELK